MNQWLAGVQVKPFFRFWVALKREHARLLPQWGGMNHDPRQHMGSCHNTILDRLAQYLQDVAPALREFFQTIRSGGRARPCPASTPVRRSSGQPAHLRTARFPCGGERLGSIWRLSASLPGRTRVSGRPWARSATTSCAAAPIQHICLQPGGRWVADEEAVVAPPPGSGTGGMPRRPDRPLLTVMPVRGTPRRAGRRAAGTARAGSVPRSAP